MTERDVFNQLLQVGWQSSDPDGVVVAGLVRGDEIIIQFPSADDGLIHAEQRVLEGLAEQGIDILPTDILYCTLEPCVQRSKRKAHLIDCCTQIITAGITQVVYGLEDPNNADLAKAKLQAAGVNATLTADPDIRQRCLELFNATVADSAKQK